MKHGYCEVEEEKNEDCSGKLLLCSSRYKVQGKRASGGTDSKVEDDAENWKSTSFCNSYIGA